jgi:nitroimidazol reductase NimA-like FMN-containing flavoprotein (pyridoxamine 5'-phosphate oxidase superfamily)
MVEDPPFADHGLEILSEQACLRLLETGRIGRVGICHGAVPAVLPVTYALVGGEVMFFTGSGVKLKAALRTQSVAFEVDHFDVDDNSGWSVLVIGRASLAGPVATARAQAVGLYPWPAGARHNLIRIRHELISGRRVLN